MPDSPSICFGCTADVFLCVFQKLSGRNWVKIVGWIRCDRDDFAGSKFCFCFGTLGIQALCLRSTIPAQIKNADSLLQHPQAPWSCFRRSRTSRKAPQTPWWSWSCRWSAPPPVSRFIALPPTSFSSSLLGPTSINTILVTSVKSVCVTSTSNAINTGVLSSISTNCGA